MLCIKLWLKGMLWLFLSSIQISKTFSISAIKLLHFFIIHEFTGVLISFKNFSFAFKLWQIIWLKRPSFWPISTFNTPSSWRLIIFSFWSKERDIGLFLSPEWTLWGHHGIIIWPNFNIILFQGIWKPKEIETDRGMTSLPSNQNTHSLYQLSLPSYSLPRWLSSKDSACPCRRWRQETWVWSPGREDPLEKELATHSSILAWRIPWKEGPGKATFPGAAKSRTCLSDWVCMHIAILYLCRSQLQHEGSLVVACGI